MLVLNDLHISASRKAGTTLESQQALREYIFDSVEELLSSHRGDLTVNGDLFDSFSVEPADLIRTFNLFSDWLNDHVENELVLSAGNHDFSPRGDKVSSFHLLCHFMSARWPDQFRFIDKGLTKIGKDVFAIPHMPNQDLFDIELQRAAALGGGVLLLHCNFDNNFASESDHSLNLSREQAQSLIDAGCTLLLGHEHQARTEMGGKVVITGNQIATSVADSLGCSQKFIAKIIDGDLYVTPYRTVSDTYQEIDWRDLSDVPPHLKFIRVSGEATSEEASEVVNLIANLRKRHDAFVISNAVTVGGVAGFDELTDASFEDMSKVDVLGLLLEDFTERERTVIKELL